MVSKKDSDGNWVEPVSKSTTALQCADEKGYSNLVAYHRKKPDIAGYTYAMKDSDNKTIDAGKS